MRSFGEGRWLGPGRRAGGALCASARCRGRRSRSRQKHRPMRGGAFETSHVRCARGFTPINAPSHFDRLSPEHDRVVRVGHGKLGHQDSTAAHRSSMLHDKCLNLRNERGRAGISNLWITAAPAPRGKPVATVGVSDANARLATVFAWLSCGRSTLTATAGNTRGDIVRGGVRLLSPLCQHSEAMAL